MTQFGRVVRLTVGPAGGRGLTLEGLRVRFARRMTSEPKPDPAEVSVWGLEKRTTSLVLEGEGRVCRLVAGYEQGTPPSVIVDGRIVPGSLDRVGSRTTFQVTEGDKVTVRPAVTESWRGAVRASEVLRLLASRLGLALSPVVLPTDPTYRRGYVVEGDARRALTEVLRDCGCRWTITDGRIVPLPLTGPSRETAVLLTPDSGMVEPARRVDGGRVQVVSLLLPSMRVGDAFRLTDGSTAGDWVATEVEHAGDSGYDRPFYTTVTGRPR